jgi:hypothetical protein
VPLTLVSEPRAAQFDLATTIALTVGTALIAGGAIFTTMLGAP